MRKIHPPSIATSGGLVLHLPLSLLIQPHPLEYTYKCNRIERSRRHRERGEKRERETDSQWQCRRPVTGYQFLRRSAGTAYTCARMLRTHTLTHTYTQQHYACTPSLRFARGQSRRALSLSRAHTRSRTYVRTHARIYE